MTRLPTTDALDRVFQGLHPAAPGRPPFRFSEPQLAAITAPVDRPSVIIAGAGSGKTTVMAARVVWLVGHHGVAPERILGLTFTNKAAAELGVRIRRSLAALEVEADGEPTTSTYHAFAGTLIAEHGLRLGIEPDLRILSDASRFQRVAQAIESYDGELAEVSTNVPRLVGDVMALDGQLSEHLVTTDELRAFDVDLIARLEGEEKRYAVHDSGIAAARKRIELTRLVDRYRRAKATAGVMDFSDQMAWGAELSAVPEVAESLRERFDVVLLDEYQDTSVAQRDLLKNLFSGDDAEHGLGHPVMAVGDPAQGIYGWRGAAAGNLIEFLDQFPTSDGGRGAQFSLVETRRCGRSIIGAANELAAEFYATSDVVQPLQAHPENVEGEVTVALHLTVADEVASVVAGVRAAIDAGHPLSEIAILVRVGGENGEIVAGLRAAGIPFEVVGLTGLLSQPEVLDLVSVLEVVDDVTANPAMLRLLTGPRWHIGPRDLALLGRRAASLSGRTFGREGDLSLEEQLAKAVEGADPTEIVSLADAVEDPGDLPYSPEARVRFQSLAGLLSGLRSHVGEPLYDFARRVMHALDLDVELEAAGAPSGLDNIALLLDAVAAYSSDDSYASLAGLLAYLEAEERYNDGMEVSTPSDADSVKLLTAHKAKGLEWRVVFVPFMAKGVFPHSRGRSRWVGSATTLPVALRGDADQLPDIEAWTYAGDKEYRALNSADALQEERRLGYVAYTRAKLELHVSGHWWGRTATRPRGPSPFLDNTRAWLAARGVEPLLWTPEPDADDRNPLAEQRLAVAWPASTADLTARHRLAALVDAHIDDPGSPDLPEFGTADEQAELELVRQIEDELELLIAEADRAADPVRTIELPSTLSATTALRLAQERDELLAELARPMPREPVPGARFGTRFHAWVEAQLEGGQQSLLDPADLPGRGDAHIGDDDELDEMTAKFLAGPYGGSTPHAIEAPFSIMLGGQQVIGRIDAVYRTEKGFDVVDWKTNRQPTSDPLQLAIYRLAWAELQGIDPSTVDGVFYYVRLDDVRRYSDLPGRADLEEQLGLT
ncbi:ATP-dependent helicase [Aeromicrobium fastidiosum]|uniref:ATP-dependent DNA helicase n=1 Tax=Aeromicrobium fastidiosum TaxID=52699 RepID=UPI0020236899|nr:ATP-dependent DNA helicase [Aeromicrobium fastidiosum]MCL8250348.1 ATP-dependent helicase [Aeromicrobium fastidiosum]